MTNVHNPIDRYVTLMRVKVVATFKEVDEVFEESNTRRICFYYASVLQNIGKLGMILLRQLTGNL